MHLQLRLQQEMPPPSTPAFLFLRFTRPPASGETRASSSQTDLGS